MMLNLIHIYILLGILWEVSCAPFGFVLIQDQKTWQEAQSYCREKHQDLVTVQSDKDRSMIQKLSDEMNLTSFAWVGLYDGMSVWHWSLQNELISFKMWEWWEPNMGKTEEACASLNMFGKWSDTSCHEYKYFFCYNENSITEFELIRISLTWRNAQNYCKTHYTDLVTIKSSTVNGALASIIFGSGIWDAWIGLSKNTWLWSDGTQVSLVSLRWIDTQPDNLDGNESCGYVRADGAMGDDVCSAPHPFFCIEFRKQQTLRMAVKADENLTEIAVMMAVEEMINQILLEKGMDAGSNITCRLNSDEKIYRDVKKESAEPTQCKQTIY
ncbi:putative C-type lectin domain family 20 member A [Misgurnus anguillicaudatus]|uniref:putative C-type lectin domain family 20 member A n=1 Tax=Misgurnus anguillicaudatus TaxID=75329 RepID=UPI003CCF96D3